MKKLKNTGSAQLCAAEKTKMFTRRCHICRLLAENVNVGLGKPAANKVPHFAAKDGGGGAKDGAVFKLAVWLASGKDGPAVHGSVVADPDEIVAVSDAFRSGKHQKGTEFLPLARDKVSLSLGPLGKV